jgi:hypothetical protein
MKKSGIKNKKPENKTEYIQEYAYIEDFLIYQPAPDIKNKDDKRGYTEVDLGYKL